MSVNRSSQHGGEFVRVTMDRRIRDMLVLCDKVVASAITIGAQGNQNSTDQALAHTLDDCLFDLSIWVENVELAISETDVSSTSLRVLDVLRGSAASTVRQVISDLELTLKKMWKNLKHESRTLSDEFRSFCDQIRIWVDQLDNLRNDLANEIISQKSDIQDAFTDRHNPLRRKITALCFDGGGIRSYSSLLVLQALMDEIRSMLAPEVTPDELIRPYEVFDYVFGSSSGGLIAIMLARLNMTDQECMDAFQTHAESIFLHRQLLYKIFGPLRTTKYSSKSIIRETKLVVEKYEPDSCGPKMEAQHVCGS